MRLLLGLAVLFQLTTQNALASFDGVPEDRLSDDVVAQYAAEIETDFADDEGARSFASETALQDLPPIDPIVPRDLLGSAVEYLRAHGSKFKRRDVVTLIDFSKPSDRARLFIVNLKTGEVSTYHTTHGLNSDPNDTGYAQVFGNEMGSGKSSVGFFKTAETYSGTFGRSMRIDGLSSTNSNVRARAIVVHASAGTFERDVKQERSFGCFTLDATIRDTVINKIKGGSLLYVDISKNP